MVPSWALTRETNNNVYFEPNNPMKIFLNNKEELSLNNLEIHIKNSDLTPATNLGNPVTMVLRIDPRIIG